MFKQWISSEGSWCRIDFKGFFRDNLMAEDLQEVSHKISIMYIEEAMNLENWECIPIKMSVCLIISVVVPINKNTMLPVTPICNFPLFFSNEIMSVQNYLPSDFNILLLEWGTQEWYPHLSRNYWRYIYNFTLKTLILEFPSWRSRNKSD